MSKDYTEAAKKAMCSMVNSIKSGEVEDVDGWDLLAHPIQIAQLQALISIADSLDSLIEMKGGPVR